MRNDENNEIVSYKARCVVEGSNHVFSAHWVDKFAVVSELPQLRLLLTVAIQLVCIVFQKFVKSFPQNADLEEY